MKKTSFFALFGVFLGNIITLSNPDLFAQSPVHNPSPPNQSINMTSPNAAALGRYGDTPVSLYTGIPSISLPLYSIKLKKMEVPISLSYHAGGIKVDDNGSDTGLGWSLNFGGSVTSAVYGPNDVEDAKGWFLTGYLTPQNYTYQADGWSPINWNLDAEYIKTNQVEKQSPYDTQPDLFFLNFNGQSTKFFYDATGQARTMPYRNISITGGPGGVTVIDEQDVKYEFYVVEESTTISSVAGPLSPAAIPHNKSYTYYISKITTPDGEVVNYEYENYVATFDNQVSELRYQITGGYCGSAGIPPSVTSSYTTVAGRRVKKMTTNTGVEINFTYGLARTDITGMSALTAVAVKSTMDNEQKASFAFTYGYNNGRLNLLSMAKDNDPPHQFEYNGVLPARLSKAQDHWGYANTSSFGSYGTTLPADPDLGFNTGVNRAPDWNAMAGMIQKITYPTGGYTLFEFENNTTSANLPTDLNRYKYVSSVPYQTMQTYFTVNGQKPGSTMRAMFNVPPGGSYYDPISGTYGLCTAEIKDLYGSTYYTFDGINTAPTGDPISLPDGDYVIEIQTRFSDGNPNAYVALNWIEVGPSQWQNILSGGVRVKSITDQPLTGTAKVRHFNYDKSSQPGFSSGWSRFNPVYVYNWTTLTEYGGQYLECTAFAQQSNSVAPLGTIQGGATAYVEAREYTDEQTKGYTYYRYSGSVGFSEYTYIYPNAPIAATDWLEGQVLEKIDYQYDAGSNTYRPLKKVVNDYKQAIGVGPNEHSVRGVRAVLYKPGIEPTMSGPASKSPEYKIQYYRFHSSWTYPTKKVETLYDPIDTNKKVVTQELYYYENPAHIALTRQEVSKSDGEEYKIQLRYPKDIDPYFAYLANPVVEKRVMIKNGSTDLLVMSELSTYLNQAGAPLDSYYALKLKTPVLASTISPYSGTVNFDYEKRLTYSYDAMGNVKTITKEGALPTVYLWSYQGQYPIAQIVGADYATVVSVLGQPAIDSFAASTPTDAQVNTFVASLRTASTLAKAQITSYTHKPLVGMSTQTDAKGMTVYYHYDAVGRLQYVKDQNGDIIKTYDYHYKL